MLRAGLEFDVENAVIPVQLTDNLQAYVKSKTSNQRINYDQLSTGIRNYLFRIGHIHALYFRRNIKRGFLFVDEPELSLFPDVLYDLMDVYSSLTENTQFFTATHSAIVASQFKPTERIILEFDEDGFVMARKGVAPKGDDPNDLLMKDFTVSSLHGKEGEKMWNRFLELQQLISQKNEKSDLDALISEYLSIGNDYGFAMELKLDAVPKKD